MNYEIESQLTVRLENSPGQLAKLSDLLATSQITIRALSISENQGEGLFRCTVCDSHQAAQTLLEKGYAVNVEEVLAIRTQDSKGKLAKLTNALWQSGINIDYMYASVSEDGSGSRLILKVSNIPLAARIIEEMKTAA